MKIIFLFTAFLKYFFLTIDHLSFSGGGGGGGAPISVVGVGSVQVGHVIINRNIRKIYVVSKQKSDT